MDAKDVTGLLVAPLGLDDAETAEIIEAIDRLKIGESITIPKGDKSATVDRLTESFAITFHRANPAPDPHPAE